MNMKKNIGNDLEFHSCYWTNSMKTGGNTSRAQRVFRPIGNTGRAVGLKAQTLKTSRFICAAQERFSPPSTVRMASKSSQFLRSFGNPKKIHRDASFILSIITDIEIITASAAAAVVVAGYDLLLGSIAALYVFAVPYTKVEESFNIQVLQLFHKTILELFK